MNKLKTYFKGDSILWAAVFLISMFSFLPVYSTSSNLQYVVGEGSVIGHFLRHSMFIAVGITIMFAFQNIDYAYFGGFSRLLLPIVILLLFVTMLQGNSISGAYASRWLKLPGISFSFQTSTFASIILMTYIARYLTKNRDTKITIKNSFVPLLLPILLVIGLIFPANGSTGVLIFFVTILLLFIGGYPIKIILSFIGFFLLVITFFVLFVLAFPDSIKETRVHTWKSRIESYIGEGANQNNYHVELARAAIVSGIVPKGPGKSALKQSLPQSSSDFIFAIIVEEYGFVGVFVCFSIYMLILWRIIVIATRIHTFFGTLVVIGVGFPIIIQAFTNMAVAVNLIPVTGQPLPLLSYGGTSMWVTYMALGIIISVSRQIKPKEELTKEEKNGEEQLYVV